VHTFGQEAVAEVETLRERHVQARVKHEMRAARLTSNLANPFEQIRSDATALQSRSYDKVVEIDEAPIQCICLRALSG
jgi:hypothetical protein